MALSDLEKSFIFEYSQRLLSQDMLTNSLFAGSGVGRDLRSLILARQPVQPLTNPSEAALTGTLRADAGVVRQNAANVGEGANMVGIAKTAVGQIADALTDMEDIIDRINNGELSASSSVVQSDYNALRDKITGLISGTDYNGISLLDGSQWGSDQIDSDGNVWIQGYKNGGFDITFHNLDGLSWSGLSGADLVGDITTQLAAVESLSSDVDAILDLYQNKQSSLEYQQTQLSTQADLLEQAVANRSPQSSSLTAEQLLLNLIFADTGSVIDETG